MIQQATEAGLFLDRPGSVASSFDDGFVEQALMRSFVVVVGQVFAQQYFKMTLGKDDEMVEAFFANGSNDALHVRVQVRRARRQRNSGHAPPAKVF